LYTIYAVYFRKQLMKETFFQELVKNVKKLRDPINGCPWDLEQNHQTLKKYLIEECYEAIDAIENEDPKEMVDELGDVLLQVLLHSIIAEENDSFSLNDVLENLNRKIIRRHPHVFSNEKLKTSTEVAKRWEQIKQEENVQSSRRLQKKLLCMPSLHSSYKIGKKTEQIGFDWSNPIEVIEKVEEELDELKMEISKKTNKIEEEYGDVLFTIAQLGRRLKFIPEESLKESNKKFIRRYNRMLTLMDRDNINPEKANIEEMGKYWEEVKSEELKL